MDHPAPLPLTDSAKPPRLIAVGGLSGVGKSTLAAALADRLGWRHLSTDGLRKQRYGLAPAEKAPEAAYSPVAIAAVYGELYERTAAILYANATAGVVADAVFAQPAERASIAACATATGAGFQGLWLDAPLAVRRERVRRRPPGLSDATVAIVEAQEAYTLGPMDWTRLPTDRGDPLAVALALVRTGGRGADPTGANAP